MLKSLTKVQLCFSCSQFSSFSMVILRNYFHLWHQWDDSTGKVTCYHAWYDLSSIPRTHMVKEKNDFQFVFSCPYMGNGTCAPNHTNRHTHIYTYPRTNKWVSKHRKGSLRLYFLYFHRKISRGDMFILCSMLYIFYWIILDISFRILSIITNSNIAFVPHLLSLPLNSL